MKVKVLLDTRELVEVVVPEDGMLCLLDGMFVVMVEDLKTGQTKSVFKRPCPHPKWMMDEKGKLVKCGKFAHNVAIVEMSTNPLLEANVVQEVVRCCKKFDMRRYLADWGRVSLASCVVDMIGKIRAKGCGRVLVCYRSGMVLPADDGGSRFGAVVFHRVGMVGF